MKQTWTHRVAWAFAILMLCVPAALGVMRFGFHLNFAAVRTGSMRPTYSPGDAVITRPVGVSDVKPGMIVLAIPPGQKVPFAHRIVSVSRHDGVTTVQTRGDANRLNDDWTDTFTGASARQVVAVAPKVGYLIYGIQSSIKPGDIVFTVGVLLSTVVVILVVLFIPVPRIRTQAA